jgi:hypothetical protein
LVPRKYRIFIRDRAAVKNLKTQPKTAKNANKCGGFFRLARCSLLDVSPWESLTLFHEPCQLITVRLNPAFLGIASMNASLSRFVASLAIVAATLGLSSMPSARAETVLGNLGANGTTGSLSTTNTGITALVKDAQVFTTPASSPNLQLASITLGAFTSTPASNPFSLQVFLGDSSAPGALFATSTNTQTLGTESTGALYTWNFGNIQMDPSTTYWIIPPTDLNWNFRGFAAPTEQNSSGYVYVGGFQSGDGGSTWTAEAGLPLATSVQAVPEPSTLVLTAAAVGLGCFGALRRRRA